MSAPVNEIWTRLVNPQQTFLHHHIRQITGQTHDLLPVDSILINRVNPPDDCRQALVRLFLYGDAKVEAPYLSIPVTAEGRKYDSLSHFLATRRGTTDARIVVLRGGSGSGKTLAARKAFLDCLPSPKGGEARLSGFLPVLLPTEKESLKLLDLEACQRPRLLAVPRLAQLLLQAAGKEKGWPWEILLKGPTHAEQRAIYDRLDHWMTGPPLLLIVELDRASKEVQQTLRGELPRLIDYWKDSRHLVVIACRDESLLELTPETRSTLVEMGAIKVASARAYLQAFLNFHARAHAVGSPWREYVLAPPKDFHDARTRLDDLKDAVAPGSGDPGIPLPLLMHLTTQFSGATSLPYGRLTNLYSQVVQRYIDRDWNPSATTPPPDLGDRTQASFTTRIILTRAATRMFHEVQQRLSREDFEHFSGYLAQQKSYLAVLMARLKQTTPYLDNKFEPETIHEILNSSLLRHESVGGPVAFLHDSFVSFFVGVLGLRQCLRPTWRSPGDNLPPEWFRAVSELLFEDPGKWCDPAIFLGGVLNYDELCQLLSELLATILRQDKLPLPLVNLLQSLFFDATDKRPPLKELERQLHDRRLREEPLTLRALAQETLGPGNDNGSPSIPLLTRIEESGAGAAAETPSALAVAHLFSVPIKRLVFQRLFFAGEARRYVVALAAGSCRAWDTETGEVWTLERRKGDAITAAVAGTDDAVYLGCQSGAVLKVILRRSPWRATAALPVPRTRDGGATALRNKGRDHPVQGPLPRTIYGGASAVTALACQHDQLVSAHADGSVWLCTLDEKASPVLPVACPRARRHRGAVRFLHWTIDLVSAGDDGLVQWGTEEEWKRAGGSAVQGRSLRYAPIQALSVCTGFAYSAHADGWIRRWPRPDPKRGSEPPTDIVEHPRPITYLIASLHDKSFRGGARGHVPVRGADPEGYVKLLIEDVEGYVFTIERQNDAWVTTEHPRWRGPHLGLGLLRDGPHSQIVRVGFEEISSDPYPFHVFGEPASVGGLAWHRTDDEVRLAAADSFGAVRLFNVHREQSAKPGSFTQPTGSKPVRFVGGQTEDFVYCSPNPHRPPLGDQVIRQCAGSKGGTTKLGFQHEITCYLYDPRYGHALGTAGGAVARWAVGELPSVCRQVGRSAITALALSEDVLVCGDDTGRIVEVRRPHSTNPSADTLSQARRLPGAIRALTTDGTWVWAACDAGTEVAGLWVYRGRERIQPCQLQEVAEASADDVKLAYRIAQEQQGRRSLRLWTRAPGTALVAFENGIWLRLVGASAEIAAMSPVANSPEAVRTTREPVQTTREAVAVGANGLWLAAGFDDGTLIVFVEGERIFSLDLKIPINHLAAHPSLRLLAVATRDRIVRVYRVPDLEVIAAYPTRKLISGLAWLGSDCLAVAQGPGVVRLRATGPDWQPSSAPERIP